MYLQSTTPGKTWSTTVFKNGKNIVAAAQEGKKEADSFSFLFPGDRRESVVVGPARMTAKAQQAAHDALVKQLVDKGFVAEGAQA